MKTKNQMEMSFNHSAMLRRALRRPATRREHAKWWFRRMRQAVEQAVEWRPAPAPRPEQTFMRLDRDDLPRAA